ncbi:hypothetical protein [Crenothrix sp.]|uniref:hypothetical protein n=1 Tax=Crenothrix sp. TaxID=3100433 RepID=UPI00374C9A27
MLRHFPSSDIAYVHKQRDYIIAAITFFCVAFALVNDADATLAEQKVLGGCAWIFLLCFLHGESKEIRVQVGIAICFATVGEHFASPFMGGYTYRFHNVPAYVPPGHGMVYLTAVALARSGLFLKYARKIATLVVLTCGLWSLWGISGLGQGDAVGAMLFCVFLIYLFKGKSPLVYLAAFFITTWLEIIGTAVGTWQWAAIDPVLGWTQGNPPSGVSAWYCWVDSVAMGGSAPVMQGLKNIKQWLKSVKIRKNAYQGASDE